MSDHSTKMIRRFLTLVLVLGMTNSIWTQNWSWLIWEVYLFHYVWHTRLIEYYKKKEYKVAEHLARWSYFALCMLLVTYIFLAKYEYVPNVFSSISNW